MTMKRTCMGLTTLLLMSGSVPASAQSNAVTGLYMVDFSGGRQPENVVVANLTKTGGFLSMGMEGKYQLLEGGKSIRIELPDEPIVTGTIESNETGFLVRAKVNSAQLVHKYTKLIHVREIMRVRGSWKALMSVHMSKERPVPTVERLNVRMTFPSLDDAEFFVGGVGVQGVSDGVFRSNLATREARCGGECGRSRQRGRAE